MLLHGNFELRSFGCGKLVNCIRVKFNELYMKIAQLDFSNLIHLNYIDLHLITFLYFIQDIISGYKCYHTFIILRRIVFEIRLSQKYVNFRNRDKPKPSACVLCFTKYSNFSVLQSPFEFLTTKRVDDFWIFHVGTYGTANGSL